MPYCRNTPMIAKFLGAHRACRRNPDISRLVPPYPGSHAPLQNLLSPYSSPLKRFAPSPLRGEGRGGGDLSTGSITALRSSYETKNPSGQSNESRTPALADVTATPGRWSEVPSAAIDRSLHRRLCVSGIQTGCRSRWRATCGFTVGCKSRCLAEIRGLSG